MDANEPLTPMTELLVSAVSTIGTNLQNPPVAGGHDPDRWDAIHDVPRGACQAGWGPAVLRCGVSALKLIREGPLCAKSGHWR